MKNIAVIRFSALGDIAAALPVLRAFKYKPTVITSQTGYELLKDEFDDFLILKDKKLSSVLKLILDIRKKGFDRVFDFQGNDRSRLISFFLNTKVYNNSNIAFTNSFQNFYDIAQPSGLLGHIDHTFECKEKNYIVLNCGSSQKWKSKRLPFKKWREISALLHEKYNLPFYLTGDKNEVKYIKELAKYIKGETKVLAGKTSLMELKSILKNAYLTVSTDSAAMHISAAQKTPTIGLFGPTNWERSKPFGAWSTIAYDKVLYSNETPPQKSLIFPGKYYENININLALNELSNFLESKNCTRRLKI